MTAKSIEEQIAVIHDVSDKASASPEYALEFLRNAGIISNDDYNSAKASEISKLDTREDNEKKS